MTRLVSRARVAVLPVALSVYASTAAAQRAATPPPRRDTLTTEERRQLREASRDASALARRRLALDSTTRRARADSAARTAFSSPEAQAILERAREARVSQDSALVAYRARTTQRISMGMGVRRVGLEKLFFRGDNVADISWRRGVGVWVNPVGSRMVIPMADNVNGDMVGAQSIPYYPGRETLWFPSSNFGVVKSDIDEREMIHPLARGAEYYYKYTVGDSIDIKLEGGRVIRVRELRITARRPEYRLFVGSFWFDRDGGQLVRAAYRMAAELEIWDVAREETVADREQQRVSNVLRDSIARARLPQETYAKDSALRATRAARNGNNNNNDDDVPGWVSATFRPAKAKLDAISVEYGLYQGRFWLPRANSASATAQVGFMRVPFSIDEKFTYDEVNGDFSLPPLPPVLTAAQRDSAVRADRVADSTARAAVEATEPDGHVSVAVRVGGPGAPRTKQQEDSIRLARMPAARRRQCEKDSVYTRLETRFEGALRIAYSMPCDPETLKNAKELPPAFAPDEEIFDIASRDELIKSLDLSLQPAFAPQRPKFRTGSDLWRYNRVEGLSLGVTATQVLGAGYTLAGTARIGHADLHANGALALSRTNGVRTVTGAVYHRLNAVNPEWAGALSFGPSIPALLYTRDEGFYFRSYGFELSEQREFRRGSLDTKLFIERQWTAGDTSVRNTFSLGRVFDGDRRFGANFTSEPAALTGASVQWLRAFGSNPRALRFTTTTRLEGATGTFAYGRGALEGTVSRQLGPVAAAVTGAIGSSVGDVPIQRTWFIGGLRTVRGQLPGQMQGDAFWLTRSEVGLRNGIARPVLFFDAGWAGSRSTFGKIQPLRGAGFGVALLDGLFRLDVARGLNGLKRWRTDLYLEAPL
jgi:hypothetical protein